MNDNVTPGPGHNQKDWEEASPYVARYENLQDKIDAIMADAREKCRPHRDGQKDVKTEAADAGFHKKPFAALIKRRKLIRKANEVEKGLTPEQQEDYESLCAALGELADLPLGEVALEKAA